MAPAFLRVRVNVMTGLFSYTGMTFRVQRAIKVVFLAAACGVLISAQAQTAHRSRRTSIPSASDNKERLVRAEDGESLAQIADRIGAPAAELARLNGRNAHKKLRKGQKVILPPRSESAPTSVLGEAPERKIVGKLIKFTDGSTLKVDEVWKQGNARWYKRGSLSQQISREVQAIEPVFAETRGESASQRLVTQVAGARKEQEKIAAPAFWIYMVGGERFKVDEVTQTSAGAWYRRGNVSIFLNRERIARIEKEELGIKPAGWRQRDWTSGNERLDELVKLNGARFGVDPYLIFCVIEQESQFHVRAVSPKGARGLMQLMPGTAARYGIRNSFDPAANILGGTQYLKELMGMFGGRVDLALASYNAGEHSVIRFGRQVPPFKETREYVKRISRRYQAVERRKPE
jgi:soluble lytic murein transglycosylase-like protein